jgi:hypothetical protein
MATGLLLTVRGDHTQDQFEVPFHELAHSVLTHTTSEAVLDPWQYPFHYFIALSHLRQDGSLAPVTEVSPSLAAIHWCFKAVVVHQIHIAVFPFCTLIPHG